MRTLVIAALLAVPAVVSAQSETQTVEARKETVVVKKRHAVVVANTLWDMAAYYYENPWLWPRIYEANKDRIKDPHWIYPGQTFIIPGLDKMVTVVKRLPVTPTAVTPPPEPIEEEAPVNYVPDEDGGVMALTDALSVDFPDGQSGQQPSNYRFRMAENWDADGQVVEFRGRESMAAAGDFVSVKLSAKLNVRKGTRFTVYRRAGITESDRDSKGNFIPGQYVQKVGVVEVVRRLQGGGYRARILKSGGSIQVEDLVKLRR
jgi:hypothetical protein